MPEKLIHPPENNSRSPPDLRDPVLKDKAWLLGHFSSCCFFSQAILPEKKTCRKDVKPAKDYLV